MALLTKQMTCFLHFNQEEFYFLLQPSDGKSEVIFTKAYKLFFATGSSELNSLLLMMWLVGAMTQVTG
jgi:hypothetical protein